MSLDPLITQSVPYRYAAQVRQGNILAGRYIRLAVARFFDWIDKADKKGYYLDHSAGLHVIEFFELFLTHTKGMAAGKAFVLSPYQQFTLYNIFAWKHSDTHTRVIKTVYEKVARKNGKTAMLAGLGLYCLLFDEEQAPEIYVGATKEAQAKVLWEQAYQFVFKSLKLRQCGLRDTQREIRSAVNLGVFRFLGGDSKTLDGLNPSVSIIDEYHAHRDDGVREVLESAMGARKQPLIYIITTAGTNIGSVCKHYEEVVKQLLEGQKEDDSTFVMIHELDKGDDWQQEDNWYKANPNLEVAIGMDYLRAEYQKVVNQPSKAANFKTKHLNMWVDAPQIWISQEVWAQNKVDEISLEPFQQYGSYGAIDLSTTTDMTAYVILSEPDPEGYRYIKPFFFCPLDTIEKRSKEDRVPYRYWKDQGFLIATPGNTVDYTYLEDTVLETYHRYNVQNIEMDLWNASQLMNNLQEKGLNVSTFSQAIATISYPTKQFEKGVYEGKLKHDGNPILSWMLSGCVLYQDANENIKVHKGQSNAAGKRVDGIIATIMALGGSLSVEKDDSQSKYNNPENEIYI
ncbi:MAG: terminase TerL endonuclease subunit [Bacteroidota bacterium]